MATKPRKHLRDLALFKHWKTPKEGDYVPYSEFVSWCAASMGVGGWSPLFDILALSAGTATLCGLVFQIKLMDVYVIGTLCTVINYITLPLKPYIVDNMGRFPKKVTRAMLFGAVGTLLAGLALWAAPSNAFFDGLLPDFLKHIALLLFVFVINSTLMALTLRWFGQKYGKFKPFMIFYGPLILALIIWMVNIPYQNMRYSRLLLMVSFITMLIGNISSGNLGGGGLKEFHSNVDNIQGRMSPNSRERTRIMSIVPIFTGLLRSIFGIVFPMLAALFGGQQNIRAYRIIFPIYGMICLVQSLLVLKVHERVLQEKGHVARAKFLKTVKEVFSNKYQWMKTFSDTIGMGPNVQEGLMVWLYIYVTRLPWATGLLVNLYKLPTSFTGQLSTPFFTKHFSKRTNMIGLRLICAALTIALIPCLGLRHGSTFQIVLLMVLSSMRTFFVSTHDVIGRTIMADIWDYQQWRSGERLEASMNYFTYVTGPLGFLVGYVMPFFLGRAGLFGDMDVLYDPAVFQSVITTQIWIVVGLTIVSALPYVFYDLSAKKVEQIGADLKERAEALDAKQMEGGELA